MEKYEVALLNDLFVVRPESDITEREYPVFEDELAGRLIPGTKVLFNMESMDFMDSQGILFFLRMHKMVLMSSGYFGMYNMKPMVENVVRRLQLNKILNVTPNIEICVLNMLDQQNTSRILTNFVEEANSRMRQEENSPVAFAACG